MKHRGNRKVKGEGGIKRRGSRERQRRIQREEIWEKIKGSKFSKWYRLIKGKKLRKDLKKG